MWSATTGPVALSKPGNGADLFGCGWLPPTGDMSADVKFHHLITSPSKMGVLLHKYYANVDIYI